MAHNLTESSTFTANVTVPDDGDIANEGSVELPFQALTNRTKFLNDTKVTGPATATDEAFARFDGSTGELLMDGAVKATDAGAVTGVTSLTLSGAISGGTTIACSGNASVGGDLSVGDDVGVIGDVIAVGSVIGENVTANTDFTYFTPKTRTKLVSASSFLYDDTYYGFTCGTGTSELTAKGAIAPCSLDINAHVPTGATITLIRLLVLPASAQTMSFRAYRRSVSGTTISVDQTVGPFNSSGAATLQWISSGAISLTGANGTTRELLAIATTTGTNDTIYLAEITYTDTGPINAT